MYTPVKSLPLCSWTASPNPQSLATTDLPVVPIDIFGVTIFETQLMLNFCIPSDRAIWLLGIYSRETLTHAHRKQAHELASWLLATPILAVCCSCCLGMLPLFDSLFPLPFSPPFLVILALLVFPVVYLVLSSLLLSFYVTDIFIFKSTMQWTPLLHCIGYNHGLEFSRLFLSSPTLQQLILQKIQSEKREKINKNPLRFQAFLDAAGGKRQISRQMGVLG